MTETERFLQMLQGKQGSRVATALTLNDASPDEAAESLRISKDVGLPSNVVAANLPTFKRESEQKKLSGLLADSPKTRKWLEDIGNGALAKDDVETLSWFERNVLRSEGSLTRAAGRGVLRMQAMPHESRARRAAAQLADMGKSYDDILAEEMAKIGGDAAPGFMVASAMARAQARADNAAQSTPQEALQVGGDALAKAREILDRSGAVQHTEDGARFQKSLEEADNSVWGFFSAVGADPIGAAAFIVETAAETLPVLAASFATTAATRNPAAGIAVMAGGSFLQENSTSAMEFLQEKGVDLSTPEAAQAVLANEELMREAANRGLTRGLVIALFDAVSGGVAGQTLMKSAGGEVAVQGLAQAFFGSAGEAAAQYASGQEIDWRDILLEGAAKLATAPVEVGGVAGRWFLDRAPKAQQADKTAQTVEQIDQMAGQSKLKRRAPEKFEEALRAQELGDFYVPAEDLREYFQAKDSFDDETLRAWGIEPEDFRAAEVAGDTVAVPKATYAAYISGTEDAAWFRDNATTDPLEMSVSEAQRFNEESREIMERAFEEVERNRQRALNERASDVQVYDNVFSQLRAAGRTRDVADYEARVWAAFWRTMGERYGADPLELAQSMGLSIRGPEQQAARSRGDLDIMLNTLRKQGDKALKPKGMGVLEFALSKGGVRDRGGDIEAMDPPKGLIAESRADIIDRDQQPSMLPGEKKGIGLDELGRALIEAGYFPEYMGGQNIDADGTVVDEAAIALEALSEALQGRERYRDGEGPDEGLTALSEALNERGIDLAASNDEIAAALEGEGLNQEGQPLYVVHNLGVENLRRAHEIGGLAAPSLAIARGDIGFSSFGEISLVGGAKMADPKGKGVRAFGADIYSPRQPRARFKVKGPALRKMQKVLGDVAERLGFRFTLDGDDVERDGLSAVSGQVAAKAAWLESIGEEIPLKYKVPEAPPARLPGFNGGTHPYEVMQDAGFEAAARAYVDSLLEKANQGFGSKAQRERSIQRIRETFLDDEGNLSEDGKARAARAAANVNARNDAYDPSPTGTVDHFATERAIDEAISGRESDFNAWVSDQFGEAVGDTFFETESGSKRAYTMRNLVREMTRELRNGEKWNYGAGNVRASVTPEFRAVADIQASRGAIIAPEQMQALKDEVNDELLALSEKFAHLHASGDTFGWGDIFSDFLKDMAKGPRAVEKWQTEWFDQPAPPGLLAEAGAFLEKLRNLPTEYFEIKMQRAVGFDEFDAAIVPSDLPDDARAILSDAGLDLIEYARGDDDARKQAVQSIGDRVFFQKYEGQEKRGSIQLPTGGLSDAFHKFARGDKDSKSLSVINLFESADLSTFTHESGHFFLEAFTALATAENAPQAMRDDLAAIHKFLGMKDGQPFTVDQHETWARGFEAYVMEGKAPSLELADAFARFKAWLTRIYRSIRGLNVKLNPEIREVMDRMLATDAEIAAAREANMMSPLFTDQKAAGMSETAWNTYQRLARRSEEDASRKLLEKTMAKVRREREAWWKAERKQVRKEVAQAITSKREYRLIEMLANQQWIGSDREVPDMRIDRDELVDAFGEGVLAELSRAKLGGKRAIYAKGGASIYEIAEFFGFDSPAGMVKILQNTGKRQDAIEAETDRIMSDRYGDPLNDGSIEEEALAAIHSDQQAQTVAAEVRHLAGQAGRSTKNLTARVFRQRARMMIGRMSIKDATRPDHFLAAERKAATRAQDAFAKVARGGGQEALANAAKYKEQQLLNHYLYMEARDLSKLVQAKREKMRSYQKKSVRAKFGEGKPVVEGGLQALDALAQIDGILEGYDFRVRSQKQVRNAASLRAWVDQMIEAGRERDLAIDPRVLEDASRKHYTLLSVDEFHGLMDTIDNLDHIGRRWGKLIDAKRQRDLDEIAGAVSGKVSERYGDAKAGEQSGVVRNFFNLLFRVDTILSDIDGEEFGRFYEEFKAPLDEGQAKEQQLNVAMAEATDRIFSVYSSKELAEMQKPRLIEGGNGHLWTKLEVLSLALNMGNEDGRNRVLERSVSRDRRLTSDQLDAMLDTLDERDWQFVQSMLDQVNTYWPELSAVHKRRTGTELKKVEALPIETKFGTFPGGYYPIAYDADRSVGAARDEASEWDKGLTLGRGAAKVSAGMTIARQKSSGGRTVDYDLTVAFRHMRKTIRVIAMSEAVDNAGRILKHPAVEQAFLDAGQKHLRETMNLFLGDIAMGPVFNTDPINRVARSVKNNFTMSKLAFNMKTTALQVTGLAQSAAVVGKRNMLRGMRDYLAHPQQAIALVEEKSPFMQERKTSFQKDIHDQMNDLQLSTPVASRYQKGKQLLAKAGFWQIQKTQFLVVDVPTWLAVYDAELKKGTSEAEAVKRADRMVARSQASGLMADRNALERGTISQNVRQSDFIRLWTTLGSYMVTKMNRAYLEVQDGKRKVKQADGAAEAVAAAINSASNLALLYVAEGLIMGLAYALMAGDDRDEDEDLTGFVMKEAAVSIIGGVPFVSDVANALQGYGGGGVLASALETPANLAIQVAQGENDAAFWRSLSDGIGLVSGLPTTAASRLALPLVAEDETPISEMLFGRNPLSE